MISKMFDFTQSQKIKYKSKVIPFLLEQLIQMKREIIAIVLLVLVASTDPGCTCGGCPNNNGGAVPVNQQIIVATPQTISAPDCAIPHISAPVISAPTVNVPTINALCIDVPTLTPPSVVAPPTITPPTPVIPIVAPPVYNPPTLPPQVPPPTQKPILPVLPIISLPTPPPPRNCVNDALSNKFTLSFQYACRPGVAFQSCLGEVVWNNAILFSIVPTDYAFHSLSANVTVQVGQNFLQLLGAGVSDSYGLLVDSVQLVREGTTTNIVQNGDFSAPNVHGSWGIFNDISGWKGNGIEVGYGPTAYGLGSNQEVELDGNANYQITQFFTFDTLYRQVSSQVSACNNPFPGTTLTYTLEFDWAVRTSGCNTDTSKANILWNNVLIGSLLYNGNSGINHASFTVTLNSGDNVLQFDGTSLSDSYGISVDNVKLTSAYNSTNLIVNGDFNTPSVGTGWSYYNGGIQGWSAARAEVGGGNNYNAHWCSGQVIELDSDSNQRYTQVITVSQLLYSSLIIQVKQIIGSGHVIAATNLAINNGQLALNNQVATINHAVQCQISMAAGKFNQYIQGLYRFTDASIRNVQANQYLTISQYSCGASDWIKYFGQSGELDFTCDSSSENSLATGWCTVLSINGKVVHCNNDKGNYHLQVAPCSHFEGTNSIPQYGDKIFWKGTQGSSGNVYVTVATTCNC